MTSDHPNPRTHPLAYARWRLGDDIIRAEWTETGLKCWAEGEDSTFTLVPGDASGLLALCERADGAVAESAGDRNREAVR